MESNSTDSKSVPLAVRSIRKAAKSNPQVATGTYLSLIVVPIFIETLPIERIAPSVIT